MAAKPDRRRNPWKKLLAEATVHDAAPKKGRALRAHVEAELRRRGLRFAPDALDELLGEVGQDLRRLMGEVDKLEAFADGRKDITADDVAAVLGRGLGQPLYLLSDAFAAATCAASLELVERLLGDGEEGLRDPLDAAPLAAAGARRRWRCARPGRPRPRSGRGCCPPNMQFKLDALLDASRRWSEADLRRALAALGRADRRMKRGARRRDGPGRGGGGVVRRERGGLLRRAEGADLARQPALVPRGGVVVDDALLRGLVDLAHGLREELLRGLGVALGDGGAELLHLGLELGDVLAVAGPALLALPHLLLGRRVMCHSSSPPNVEQNSSLVGSSTQVKARAEKARIARAAGLVSAMTLVSRVLGLVREVVFAALLGAGYHSDAFRIGFRIPNLLRDLFAEGALSAAFVPTYARAQKEGGREAAFALANRVLTLLAVAAGGRRRARRSSSPGRSSRPSRPASTTSPGRPS